MPANTLIIIKPKAGGIETRHLGENTLGVLVCVADESVWIGSAIGFDAVARHTSRVTRQARE